MGNTKRTLPERIHERESVPSLDRPYHIVIWKDYTGKVYRSVVKYGGKGFALFSYSDIGVQIPHMRRVIEEGADYVTFKSVPVYMPPSREVLYMFTVRKNYLKDAPAY